MFHELTKKVNFSLARLVCALHRDALEICEAAKKRRNVVAGSILYIVHESKLKTSLSNDGPTLQENTTLFFKFCRRTHGRHLVVRFLFF